MSETLTIIKNPHSLANYPFTVLPPDVIDIMLRCGAALSGHYADRNTRLLKIFEAYCHITGSSVTYVSLSSPPFTNVAKGFLGALADESLISISRPSRLVYAKTFLFLLDEMRKEIPLLPILTPDEKLPKNNHYLWEQAKKHLDQKTLRYWCGWEIPRKGGKFAYPSICLIWNSHGEDFAEELYKRYYQSVAKKNASIHTEFNLFLIFLSENADRWPASSFQHPMQLKKLFTECMFFNFQHALNNGSDLISKARNYSKFIHTIDETFIQSGIWARPFGGRLPRPPAKNPPGTNTNIKKLADGTLIKNKLITEVPLNLTDSEAIEILFKKIKSDNNLVVKWAKNKISKLRKDQLKRNHLALEGTPIKGGNTKRKNISECGAHNICATFEKYGLAHLRNNRYKIAGSSQKSDLAKLLALPSAEHFFAFQLLLVNAHPCITESFFAIFELYDKRGNLSGFLKTNNGYQLIGYKDRKGPSLSEQSITLTRRQAVWVRQIISLTQPLRDELHAAGDDAWRYLFLHCPRTLDFPKRPSPFAINSHTIRHQQGLINDFHDLTKLDREIIKEFLLRVSVTAFRASSAVEVFINTNNAEAMAHALGHTKYEPSLLNHYLPEPIFAFLQTRWIRIFQRGIICKAMKDSPRLLEVARFESMDELDAFLKNHALRDIPQHLQHPDYLSTPASKIPSTDHDSADQLVISIDTGILTTLISLKNAVANAESGAPLCSKAIYWARFTDLVVHEIEDSYNSDLQNYLSLAKSHSNASKMEKLIYATTP